MNEPTSTSTSTSSSTERDRTWLRWQAVSGAVFSVFLFVHLVNQALATLGCARYDAVQGALEKGYQFLPVELVVVVAAMLVHMVTAVRMLWRRRSAPASPPPGWRVRLHRYSGRFLLVFALGHFAATRGTALVFGTAPQFAGVAWTFEWMPFYFWPYYTLLGLCGWYHAVHGLATAGALLHLRWLAWLRRPLAFQLAVGAGVIGVVLGVLSFGGVLFDVGDPAASPFAKTVLTLVGG